MSPASRGRAKGSLFKGRCHPLSDELGIWVPVAAILVVGVAITALTVYVTREVPRLMREEEFRQLESIKEDLVNFQQGLEGLGPGSVADLQLELSQGTSTMYSSRLSGSVSVTDALSSGIRVITHNTRRDFEEGMQLSENGLSENLLINNDPSSEDYGALMLDNNWEGNRFITNVHRSPGYEMTYGTKSWFSMRFVAQKDGMIDEAWIYVRVFENTNNDNFKPRWWNFWIAEDDGGDPGNNICDRITVDIYADDQLGTDGGEGWVHAEGLDATVTEGNTYHLVIQNREYNYNYGVKHYLADPFNYITINYTEPRNPVWVDGSVSNENRGVIFAGKESGDVNSPPARWIEFMGVEPTYVLKYASGDYEGNPYHAGIMYYRENTYYPDTQIYGENRSFIVYNFGENYYSAGKVWSESSSSDDYIWGEHFNLSDTLEGVTAIEVPVARRGLPSSELEVTIGNLYQLQWSQIDWSGGPTYPNIEVGTWGESYSRFYQGEDVDWENNPGKMTLGKLPELVEKESEINTNCDSYVDEGRPNSNFGEQIYIWVGSRAGANRGYVKFDLGSIPSEAIITDAKLWLYMDESYYYANVQVERVDDDSWIESGPGGITWTNQPARNGKIVDSQQIPPRRWGSWTSDLLTKFVDEQYAGDKLVSLCLVGIEENISGSYYAKFFSKERGGLFVPYLEVTYLMHPFKEDGWFTSSIFDSQNNNSNWTSIDWSEVKPADTNIVVKVRFDNSSTGILNKPWQQVANGGTIDEYARYAQYRVELTTEDEGVTPELLDIQFNYELPPNVEIWTETHVLSPEDIVSGDTPWWYRIPLNQPRDLAIGNYRIYLRTEGPTHYDYYLVPLDNASGLPVDLSWDDNDSYAIYSTENGNSWETFTHVDMPFRLIKGGYRSPAMYTSSALAPGRRVKWLNLSWDAETPGNTDIQFQVRVGDMAHPENPNLLDDPNYPWSSWQNVEDGQDLGEIFGENQVANCLQYRVMLTGDLGDSTVTPVVRAIYVRYYDGVGTTRQLPLKWVQTTGGDFAQYTMDSVHASSLGWLKLDTQGGDRWEKLPSPPFGVGNNNGARLGAAQYGGNLENRLVLYSGCKPGYSWYDYQDFYLDSDNDNRTAVFNPATNTWSLAQNAPYASKYAMWTTSGGDKVWIVVGDYTSMIPPGSTSYNFNGVAFYTPKYNNWTEVEQPSKFTNYENVIKKTYYRNAPAAAWFNGYLYTMGGAAYSDQPESSQPDAYEGRRLFLRTPYPNVNWKQMTDTPWIQGPGDAMVGVTHPVDGQDYLYAWVGTTSKSRGAYTEEWRGSKFVRFIPPNPQSQKGYWEHVPYGDNPETYVPGYVEYGMGEFPYGSDDGASLVWPGQTTGQEYFIYFTPGAYNEGLPAIEETHLLRFNLLDNTWEEMEPVPYDEQGGIDDGSAMAYIPGDKYIYLIKGGADSPAGGGNTYDNDFYRYELPGSYYADGEFESIVFDAGEIVEWENIEWDAVTPDDTSITLSVRFSNDGVNWEDYQEVSNGESFREWDQYKWRYLQYKGEFHTENGFKSPRLDEVRFYYTPIEAQRWIQTDWSGGSTSPNIESGTWTDEYDRYYTGENVDATVSVGDVALVSSDGERSWGNSFIVDTTLASDTLDGALDRLSLRFRARRTEDVYGMRVYIENYQWANLVATICEDNAVNPGKPGENLVPENAVMLSSTGWLYIGFSEPAELVEDNVYHLVFRMEPTGITEQWVQTDWSGGPTYPDIEVGEWDKSYDKFYENENVDWSQAGKIRLKGTGGSGSKNLNPTADSFVSSKNANTNYGTNDSLFAGYWDTYWVMRSFLKFDLSSVPSGSTITSAFLHLYVTYYSSRAEEAREVTNDTWTESGITWNNQPTMGAVLDTKTVSSSYRWWSWNVTSFVNSQFQGGDNIVSLGVKQTDESEKNMKTYSKEGSNRPYLAVSYIVPATYKNGWFTSSIFDASNYNANWYSIDWSEVKPADTNIVVKVRFDNSSTGILNKPWQQVANGGTIDEYARYAQYRVELTTEDEGVTPELLDIQFNYELQPGADRWKQTDWTGGGGQTMWSDENKFDTSENIDWENLAGSLTLVPELLGGDGNLFRLDEFTIIGRLDDDDYLADMRFTAQATRTYTGVRFYVNAFGGTPTLWVRLCNDQDGEPNLSSPIAEGTAGISSTGWKLVNLRFSLTAGNVYHIVISRSLPPIQDLKVTAEPDPLVDTTPRVGVVVGGSYQDTWTLNGNHETIGEESPLESWYQEVEGPTTTTSPTPVPVVTLDVTPEVTADYVIMASALVSHSNAGSTVSVDLFKSPTIYSSEDFTPRSPLERYVFAGHKVLTLTANTIYTFQIRFWSTGIGTATIQNARLHVRKIIEGYKAEYTGMQGTTSTSPVDAVTLQVTPSSSDNYLVLASADFTGSSTDYSTIVRLMQDTQEIARSQREPTVALDYYNFATMKRVQLTGGTPYTFKIQYATTGATAFIIDPRITVVRLSSWGGSWYAEDDTESYTNSTSYQTKVSLGFTGSAGEYLVVASAMVKMNYEYDGARTRLVLNDVNQAEKIHGSKDVTDYVTFFTLRKLNLSPGDNLKIQWCSYIGSGTSYIKQARIIVIPLLDYKMRWEHFIDDVTEGYATYNLRIYGYADGDEPVGVSIWNDNNEKWEFISNLPTSWGWVETTISEIGDYITAGGIAVGYFQEISDTVQTKIYLDYVVLEERDPITGWVEVKASEPLNHLYPYDCSTEPNANTLWSTNGGSSWTVQNYQPIYVLEHATNREGNAYAEVYPQELYETIKAGEQFTLSQQKTFVQVSAYVRTPDGVPNDDLYFAIRQGTNVLRSGLLAESAEYADYTWLSATFSDLTLNANIQYNVVFYSPGSSIDKAWELDVVTSNVFSSLSYKGTTYAFYYEIAYDNRDAVYLLGESGGGGIYKPSGWLQSSWREPISGQSVDWSRVDFSYDEPSGTNVRVYVQVSDDNTVPWSPSGGPYESGDLIGLSGRYCRYRVYLDAGMDGLYTPRFDNIGIFYSTVDRGVALRISEPLNQYMAYDSLTPDDANVLFSSNEGSSWTARDKQPIFVLDVDTDDDASVDGHDGDPYAVADNFAIWGTNYAGETITISSSFAGGSHHVRGAQAYVRAVGIPADSLYYELWDLTNGTQLENGVFATPLEVGGEWAWVSKTFSSEHLLVAGRSYRFYLKSPGSDGSNGLNYYKWMAPGAGVTGNAYEWSTYGGTSSVASYYSGSWVDDEGRDVLFHFTAAQYNLDEDLLGEGALESSVFDVGEDTTSIEWLQITWSEVTSPQTEILAYTRTGTDNNPIDGNWSDWEQTTNGGQVPSPTNRYIQYKVQMSTSNENETPVLQGISIRYLARSGTAEAPENSMIRTLVQTTRSDFLGDRRAKDLGANVEIVPPGDITLKAASYWGDEFTSTSGYSSAARMDDPNKIYAIRFVAEHTGAVRGAYTMVQVTVKGEGRGPTKYLDPLDQAYWRIRLVGNDPATNWPDFDNVLADNSKPLLKDWGALEHYMNYPRLEAWFDNADEINKDIQNPNLVPYEDLPKINQGEIYHLVIGIAPGYENYIDRDTYIRPIMLRPRNAENTWINNKSYNLQRDCLFSNDNGATWENSTQITSVSYDREPVYVLVLDLNDGGENWDAFEGNGYYKSGDEVYEHNYVGQRVILDKDFSTFLGDNLNVAAIEFFMQSTTNPPSEVHVGMRTKSGKLAETTYSTPLDIDDWGWEWARFTLPTSRTLWEDEMYDIYVRSPSSSGGYYASKFGVDWTRGDAAYVSTNTLKHPWVNETPYAMTGYGGAKSAYIWSIDDVNWYQVDHRETPFRFVTSYQGSGTFFSDVIDAGQVADWSYIEWDATRPPGTTIDVYVRVGNSPNLTGVSWHGPYLNGDGLANLPNARYIQYRIELGASEDKLSAPAVHEVRIAYNNGFGSVRAELKSQISTGQVVAYEGGAVVIKQDDRSTMYSKPSDMIVVDNVGELLKLDVNYRLIRSATSVKSTSMTGAAGVRAHMQKDVFTTVGENRDNVQITICSDFAEAWEEYLNDVAQQINSKFPGASSVTYEPSEGRVTLTVNGPKAGSEKDVIYTERVREIFIQIL